MLWLVVLACAPPVPIVESGTSTGGPVTLDVGPVTLDTVAKEPGCPGTLDLVASDGVIDVDHASFDHGCCPDGLTVSAVADPASGVVDVAYTLGEDDCDCIGCLEASYTLSGVPAGSWTVVASGDAASVVVP